MDSRGASALGAVAGLMTSLTITLESDAWSCKSTWSNVQVAALSLLAFAGVNAMEDRLTESQLALAHQGIVILPPLLHSLNEYLVCSKRAGRQMSLALNSSSVLCAFAVPLVVYRLSASTQLHARIQNFLQKGRLPPGGGSGRGRTNAYYTNLLQNELKGLPEVQQMKSASLQQARDLAAQRLQRVKQAMQQENY